MELSLLLVDDDPDYRTQVQWALRKIGGFTVVEARDGIDALGKYHESEHGFDVVLSDTQMPRMNGPALRVELSSLGYKGLFLLMSGLADSAPGIDIVKPMMPEVLRASLAVRLRPKAKEPELTVS